ncbi:MAG: dienelactone hydrolase family protein [Acidobacteria bacterium]|nr:MAG: dienelactone hydrolase family protein [Acidobacteriota bacterium]REJ99313.1 MAG: dienelactone hydrolase family protein [Acidobacteriota bacterium]REK15967.1 MAG: dienelactone hydrolase family protein [Acidobacteriota bacterium]REK43648.1 MAG: dienelactone hydrolase family protein [Acidobacteriota bacterium]
MNTKTLSFSTANGDTTAYCAIPDNPGTDTPAVILIQEWWGLNDHIKDIAGRYASEGFIAVAPDLYRGKLAKDPEEASKMMADLAVEDGIDTIRNTVSAAGEEFGKSGFGISGYCMGGTYALRSACLVNGIKASAPFYGDIPSEEVLADLSVPVLFVSGLKDAWINPEKVGELETATFKHDLPVEVLKYDADHAFFNDTRPEVFDEEAANDAWSKVLAFFRKHL